MSKGMDLLVGQYLGIVGKSVGEQTCEQSKRFTNCNALDVDLNIE